jgi:hypothetical protein
MSDYYAATFLVEKTSYKNAVVPLVPLHCFGEPTGYDALTSVRATLLATPHLKELLAQCDLKDLEFDTYVFALQNGPYPLCRYSYEYALAKRPELDRPEISFNLGGVSFDCQETKYTAYDKDPIVIAQEELAEEELKEGDGEPLLCYRVYPVVFGEGKAGGKGLVYPSGAVAPIPPMDIGTILELQLMAHAADRTSPGSLFNAGNISDSIASFALRKDSVTGGYTARICLGNICLLYKEAPHFNREYYDQTMEAISMVDEMTGGHYRKSMEAMERNASIKKGGEDKLVGYYSPDVHVADSQDLIKDFRIFALTCRPIEPSEDVPDSDFYTYEITQCSDPVIMNGHIFPYDPLLK